MTPTIGGNVRHVKTSICVETETKECHRSQELFRKVGEFRRSIIRVKRSMVESFQPAQWMYNAGFGAFFDVLWSPKKL